MIDKYNKRYKYTLDEALQAVLEFNDESDYSDLSDLSEVSIQRLYQLQLVFVTDPLQQKQLDATDVSNTYSLFRYYIRYTVFSYYIIA